MTRDELIALYVALDRFYHYCDDIHGQVSVKNVQQALANVIIREETRGRE